MPQAVAAFGLTAALTAGWTVIGLAVAALLDPRRAPIHNMLLAPVYGVAVVVLAVFLLTRAGLTMLSMGPALAGVLLLAAIVVLWRSVCRWPLKSYAFFASLFVAAALVVGWPMLTRGFGWLAMANDDMANYVLGADLLLKHGFAGAPDYAQLAAGQDYSQYYWFALIPGGARPGSELLLGWVVSLTGLSGHQAFMPLILALQVCLISAASALAFQSRQSVLAAWLTGALVAISALTTLGVLYQLIAQVTGLGLLIASAELLLGSPPDRANATLVRLGVLIGLVVTALFVVYPEVFPFLVLAFILHRGLQLLRRDWDGLRWLIPSIGAGGVSSLLLLNTYLPRVVDFLLYQVTAGLQPSEIQSEIFPYFLLPSGLADLWGLQVIGDTAGEPWMSVSIAIGGLLLAGVTVLSLALLWRGHPVAAMATPMLVFSVRLMMQQSGFGLFKLAMYAQPLLLGTIVVGCLAWARRRRVNWQLAPLVVLGGVGLIGQTWYVQRSTSAYGSAPSRSTLGLVQEFKSALAAAPVGPLVLDSPEIVLAKIQSIYTEGRAVAFPNREYFSNIVPESIWLRDPVFRDSVESQFVTERFPLMDPSHPNLTDEFIMNTLGNAGQPISNCNLLVSAANNQTIFNGRHRPLDAPGEFVASPCDAVSNHLFFIHSALGLDYYWVGSKHFDEPPSNISLYQLEADPLRPGGSMAGIGRILLFEVLHPTTPLRVVLELTDSLKSDAQNLLPPAAAIGTTREPLPIVGRGSARVVSPPLQPRHIDGRDYLALDMGVEGVMFRGERTGLTGLYGADIPLDRRQLVAFGRDISVVSEADYAQMKPPARLDDFTHQLQDPNLEYSGIYEDGWVGDRAYVRLDGGTAAASRIAINGQVPDLGDPGFAPEVRVLVDGVEVARQQLGPGDFSVVSPPVDASGLRKIELEFSQTRNLPGPDKRPIAAKLRSISVGPAATTQASDIVTTKDMSLGSGWYPLETFGGERFRWVGNDAEVVLTPSTPKERAFRLQVEPGPGVHSQPFMLQVLDASGGLVTSVQVASRQTVDVPVPLEAGQSMLFHLHVDGGGAPAPNDPRTLNFRVFSFEWAN